MRKPISELTRSDLAATPVWELSGDDGELALPTSLTALSEYRDGPVHIAATRYVAISGDTYHGYCSPADASGVDYTRPVVLTPRGPMALWHDGGLPPAHVALLASAPSVAPDALFPLRLECLVPVDGVMYTDSIDVT